LKDLVTKREIDVHFEKLAQEEKDESAKQKLLKLPTGKRWEFLAEHAVKLKTSGEEEEGQKDTFFYFIGELKKNPDLDLETMRALMTKLDNADAVGFSNLFFLMDFSGYSKV
jgi:hypothetical protein